MFTISATNVKTVVAVKASTKKTETKAYVARQRRDRRLIREIREAIRS
jgi:hypothetical protein